VSEATFSPALVDASQRLQSRARIAGAVALAACAIGFVFAREQFFRSYLLGYLLVLGVTLGSLAILMLQHLTGGAWGLMIRRILEAAVRTMPVMVVLFLPLLAGLSDLFLWARPEAVAADTALQAKSPYLNVPFFLVRAAFYFAAWTGLALILARWSAEQDAMPEALAASHVRRFRLLGAPGLLLYGLTVTFAAVDWVMSLDPHWFSTIIGVLIMGGQGLSALAFAIAALAVLSRYAPLAGAVRPAHFHDLGKLLLAFVMLWAYFSFSQFLIIWSANLPEEIPWYLHRMHGGWQWIALALVIGHFVLPFLLLLSRDIKRRAPVLMRVAIALIVMRLFDLFWLIAPNFHEERLHVHWMDLAAPAGLGAVWLSFFIANLRTRPLLPMNDPYLKEALEEHADSGGAHEYEYRAP
jgi:hypothetical protein